MNTLPKFLTKIRSAKKTVDVHTIVKNELLQFFVEQEEQDCGTGPATLSALRKHLVACDERAEWLKDQDVVLAAKVHVEEVEVAIVVAVTGKK